jgi:hypothetical protein
MASLKIAFGHDRLLIDKNRFLRNNYRKKEIPINITGRFVIKSAENRPKNIPPAPSSKSPFKCHIKRKTLKNSRIWHLSRNKIKAGWRLRKSRVYYYAESWRTRSS